MLTQSTRHSWKMPPIPITATFTSRSGGAGITLPGGASAVSAFAIAKWLYTGYVCNQQVEVSFTLRGTTNGRVFAVCLAAKGDGVVVLVAAVSQGRMFGCARWLRCAENRFERAPGPWRWCRQGKDTAKVQDGHVDMNAIRIIQFCR